MASTLTPPSSSLITSSVLPSLAAAISFPSSSYSDINLGEQRRYNPYKDNHSHQTAVRDVVVKAMFVMKDTDELQQYFEPHMPSVVTSWLHPTNMLHPQHSTHITLYMPVQHSLTLSWWLDWAPVSDSNSTHPSWPAAVAYISGVPPFCKERVISHGELQ